MSKKKLTSWERRRRRTIRITVMTVLLFVIAIGGFIAYRLIMPYETWELKQFYTVTYEGYDGNGSAVITLDQAKLDDAVETLKNDYREALIHLDKCTGEDYTKFADSINATLMTAGNLSNGQEIGITYDYDRALAKRLHVKIPEAMETRTVEGLPVVTLLSKEDLFRDLSINCSGISPDVKVSIVNNSTDPFIKSVVFQPVEPKDHYANGDVLSIRAFFNADDALKSLYAVSSPSEECVKDYAVSVEKSFVTDASQLSASFMEEAKTAGLDAFKNANEYGVRIFCEANLVPVYVNKQATFEWVKPAFRSAYLKCLKDDYPGANESHCNDLDLIYEVSIKQANGVSCPCYAVVRFSDLLLAGDGTIESDLSHPKVMSADYKIDNIHKTVASAYEGTHFVTKVSVR
ncbi:MAG: hypothetical protein K6E16_05835 [Lachnospiraceae bacterium]|nr:hypothetical protein [Lachnospiraceae bacterium]